LLEAAARRESVAVERARAFATACIEMTEIGRLGMGVLDGGVFAATRLVELAEKVAGGAVCPPERLLADPSTRA
jgi:hypothetical protein